MHLRHQLNETARLEAVNSDGTLPRRDQTLPSLTQFRRVSGWATRLPRSA